MTFVRPPLAGTLVSLSEEKSDGFVKEWSLPLTTFKRKPVFIVTKDANTALAYIKWSKTVYTM